MVWGRPPARISRNDVGALVTSPFVTARHWLRRAAPSPRAAGAALGASLIVNVAGLVLSVGTLALLLLSSRHPPLRNIAVFLVIVELVAFLRAPLRLVERMTSHRVGFDAVGRWRGWVMSIASSWSDREGERLAHGDLLTRALDDTDELQDLWLRGLFPALTQIALLIGGDVVLAVLAPTGRWLAVTVLVVLTQSLTLLLWWRSSLRVAHAIENVTTQRGRFASVLVPLAAVAPDVVDLGRSEYLRRQLVDAADSLAAREHRAALAQRRASVIALGAGLIITLIVIGRAPLSAPVWWLCALWMVPVTDEALRTLSEAAAVAARVSAAGQRLDDLVPAKRQRPHPWPGTGPLTLHALAVGDRHWSATYDFGAHVALVGPSGCGKSTALRAVAGLRDEGPHVTWHNVVMDTLDESARASHVHYVSTEPGLVTGYVRDIIGVGHPLRDEVAAWLATGGLDWSLDDHLEGVSRGEAQRLALVRALNSDPDLLVLDEPTSGLGERETAYVLALLRQVRGTIVVATHDRAVQQWCDVTVSYDELSV